MDAKQLTQGLHQAFSVEGHRIVFWYDPEGAFAQMLDELEMPEVQLLDMRNASTFDIKLLLELQDQSGKYLLYFQQSEPEPEYDWLLDIKLYSRTFHADRISLIFNQLGLQRPSLREHLRTRQLFLSSKSRINALAKILSSSVTGFRLPGDPPKRVPADRGTTRHNSAQPLHRGV